MPSVTAECNLMNVIYSVYFIIYLFIKDCYLAKVLNVLLWFRVRQTVFVIITVETYRSSHPLRFVEKLFQQNTSSKYKRTSTRTVLPAKEVALPTKIKFVDSFS